MNQEYWMNKMTEEFQVILEDCEEEAKKRLTININAAMDYVSNEFMDKIEDVADQYYDGITQADMKQAINHHKNCISTVIRDGLVQALQDEFRLRATQC